ncbi:hypothetical protein [Helicobacter pylori]|nr:hypothetical protein [Helicobacter pylori]EJB98505.1 hypothetical protein HPHPP1_0199 [Helicobacter pylori Hp P-1]EJC22663.1 hypothetical protein HPHPP1B_0223 [Helicobacter pylori Hp P-1b]
MNALALLNAIKTCQWHYFDFLKRFYNNTLFMNKYAKIQLEISNL